jgi:hypothetical protein
VRCAVTGRQIPLADLKYWNVELQEPYSSAEVSLQRYLEVKANGVTSDGASPAPSSGPRGSGR